MEDGRCGDEWRREVAVIVGNGVDSKGGDGELVMMLVMAEDGSVEREHLLGGWVKTCLTHKMRCTP